MNGPGSEPYCSRPVGSASKDIFRHTSAVRSQGAISRALSHTNTQQGSYSLSAAL